MTVAIAQILAVEDQAATASLISDVLKENGYEVSVASTLAQARKLLSRALPDLMILDRAMPDGDGLDLCRELRENPKSAALPILILTARKAVEEKVSGLMGGADDYLVKPFSTQELSARIAAVLRRAGKASAEPDQIKIGPFKMDKSSRRLFANGKEIPLSSKEFDLLWVLASYPEKVLSRDFLLQHVWGYEGGIDLNTKVVDVTLSHIREKIGPAADRIAAIRGIGYRFDRD